MKTISPFHTSLKGAKFTLVPCTEAEHIRELQQSGLDFMWLLLSQDRKLPLFNGFFAKFITDNLPKTVIAYMDPISKPPTRNDVVQETMVRTLKVAKEMKQDYAIVSYDLAVALKAFSIQALQAPLFDNLIILLGNFHLEMAFYAGIGTFIADSGIDYLLTEAGILATGSLVGFLKGKFYNRCTRIHQIIAAVMERALLANFKETVTEEEALTLQETLSHSSDDVQKMEEVVDVPIFKDLLVKYEQYLQNVMDGQHGSTAAYWGIYVYLINRVHRELQRAVRTNNVMRYIQILPYVIETFFALNRPNYARWGSLFLSKLRQMDPKALDILQAGAFSIRRTSKSYSRCAVDLTLEQTVNKDASSPMRGITAFRNSESAFRRWSITLTQRGMALSELRQLVGLHSGEHPASQSQPWRVRRDNNDIETLARVINDTCNPFATHSPHELVNLATGKEAKEETKVYLLSTLKRGVDLRQKFETECEADNSRFLKTVKRAKVFNFATENQKPQCSGKDKAKAKAEEGVRDVFARILALESKTNVTCDLQHILAFPITDVPLSLAHSDGTPNKTDKACLTKLLEGKQDTILTDISLPPVSASVVDGGCILHETLLRHSKSTYGTMARDLLVKVCSFRGEEIHLVLDKYVSPSIKDQERKSRGRGNQPTFVISGPDQAQRHTGIDLLKNSAFKEEFAHFIVQEWRKPHYGPILGRKILYVSHGGECSRFMFTETEDGNQIQVDEPSHLQGQHEEADTLIAFHVRTIHKGAIMVRSSDTDVLVILIGLVGRSDCRSLIMDYGSGNHRRYINVSFIAGRLEEKRCGMSEALIGFHALTGCDFTSAFNRLGKVKPFKRLEAITAELHVKAMRSLTSEVDMIAVTCYVCALYGFNTSDINEARYKAFMHMCGGKEANPLARMKKINCASLPPCYETLSHHIKRANFVAKMWKKADEVNPTGGESPVNYGWMKTENGLQPVWFTGNPVPSNITKADSGEDGVQIMADEDQDSDSVWSEDSDNGEEEDK